MTKDRSAYQRKWLKANRGRKSRYQQTLDAPQASGSNHAQLREAQHGGLEQFIQGGAGMKMCSVPDCGGVHHAKGFCEPHYNSFWLYGHPTDRPRKTNERFIRSESLAPLGLTTSQEASLLSLVRFLPGKQP